MCGLSPLERRSNKEKVLGPDHPDVAITLNNLALLLKSEGKLREAQAMYLRALRIFKRCLTSDHPHLITCVDNYSHLLREIGQTEEATQGEVRFGLLLD